MEKEYTANIKLENLTIKVKAAAFPDGDVKKIDAYEVKDENGEVIETVIPPESQFIKMSSVSLLSNK